MADLTPEAYTVFDLEMTGLSGNDNKIIEIGALRIRNGAAADTYETLVNPHMPIAPVVVGMTKITDGMLKDGREEDEAIGGLIAFIGDDPILGHGTAYDFSFIKQWADAHGVPFERYAWDSFLLADALLPKEQPKKLPALCRYFSIECSRSHRALFDAACTAEVFERLKEMARQSGREELLKPTLLTDAHRPQPPASRRQKTRLREYMRLHKIKETIDWEHLTKNQASRKMDRYRARYGKADAAGGQSKKADAAATKRKE